MYGNKYIRIYLGLILYRYMVYVHMYVYNMDSSYLFDSKSPQLVFRDCWLERDAT